MTTEAASDAGNVDSNEPLYLDGQAEFNNVVSEYDVVLTDFYADWCGRARRLNRLSRR